MSKFLTFISPFSVVFSLNASNIYPMSALYNLLVRFFVKCHIFVIAFNEAEYKKALIEQFD